MGKKKSVVLLTLLTIVIVVLCATIVVPSFTLPFLWKGAVSDWNPVVKTYDLGADLGGGYYTYYYPEGVISETEYKDEYTSKTDDAEKEEYKNSYVQHKGLYLSNDSELGIIDSEGNVTQRFKDDFAYAADVISARFEKKGYSSYRVSVVDDYVLRVELPKSERAAGASFTYFSNLGQFSLSDGSTTLFEADKDTVPSDYFKGFAPKTNRDATFVMVKLTDKGRTLIKDITTKIVDDNKNQEQQQAAKNLVFKVGDETIIQLSVSEVINEKTLYIGGGNYDEQTAQTISVLLNSSLNAQEDALVLKADEISSFEPVYGDKALTLLYIAIIVVLVAAILLPVIKYRGFGGAMAYSTLSYFIITAICFAFITSGVFEITLGSVITFLFGLVLTVFINAYIYDAIKSEVLTGKTVESSVKAGFKKTIWGIVDIYAVLAGAALFLLIGAAGLHTMALQALICLVTGAFCNLLWTRFINYMMLSASKDKYKYFRFVREDDDDE